MRSGDAPKQSPEPGLIGVDSWLNRLLQMSLIGVVVVVMVMAVVNTLSHLRLRRIR
jgi:hypothetical protein